MNNNSTQTEMRSKWVDAAKFMAIMGVMIDHTNTILYTNQLFAWFSYYSVSLFVVAMGITTMWSYRRNSAAIPEKVWKKCLGILRPYIVATVIYGVFLYKTFDFETLLHHIIRFDMSGPFYYVLLYLQLVLISPVLFRVFEKADEIKRGYMIETLGFLAVLGISNWTTKYSNILNVYGGGGKAPWRNLFDPFLHWNVVRKKQ